MGGLNIPILLFLTAWTVTICLAADTPGWNYKRNDLSIGPSAWATNFPQCGLSSNSPIDIVEENALVLPAPAWSLSGWESSNTWTILDTLYTIKYSLTGAPITTDGGDLGTYDMIQFHFHWGATNLKGSEHLLNGKSYPMELHFVHKSREFSTIGDAVISGNSDALAAVGFFFEIQANDNPGLARIIEGIKLVRMQPNLTMSNFLLNPLNDFTSEATAGNFYRYFGGLTTPACQEIVKWTVFEKPIGISQAQMDVFRSQSTEKYGSELYRDIQPIGSRVVTLFDTECARGSLKSAALRNRCSGQTTGGNRRFRPRTRGFRTRNRGFRPRNRRFRNGPRCRLWGRC